MPFTIMLVTPIDWLFSDSWLGQAQLGIPLDRSVSAVAQDRLTSASMGCTSS